MILDKKILILIAMFFLHIVDDYYLQGVLVDLKQKSWWQEHTQSPRYRHDYKIALIEHAFSWSFMIMLPTYVCLWTGLIEAKLFWIVALLVWNVGIHALVDHLKANRLTITLVADQLIHFVQILITWLVFFIVPV